MAALKLLLSEEQRIRLKERTRYVRIKEKELHADQKSPRRRQSIVSQPAMSQRRGSNIILPETDAHLMTLTDERNGP